MSKRHRLKANLWASASCLCVLFLGACGGNSHTPSSTTANTQTLRQPANTTGRLLASNCFQCHGTGGIGGFENIRGHEAAEVRNYLMQAANGSIMAAHAQGYTSAQLDAIITYLQQ
jgi:sulfide dehydrogenase cytochrome subunit